MNKLKKNKRLENLSIVKNAALVFLIGVIILGALQYYEYRIVSTIDNAVPVSSESGGDTDNDEQTQKEKNELSSEYLGFVQPILYNIGVIFIVLAAGTMLMELFGYVSFFQKRIAEVFTEKKMVNIISEEYQRELKSNLIECIYKPDTVDSKEILNLFDNKLSNIMDTYYYSSFDIFAECSLLDGKYIKKEITRTIVFKEINSKKNNSFKELLSLSYKDLNDGGKYKPVEMHHVYVNGDELVKGKDYDEINTKSKKPYPQKVTFLLNNDAIIDNELTLILKYDTIVPLQDRNYSTTMNSLCKNMRCRVSYDKENFEVFVKGFKFSTESKTDFICEHFDSLSEANSNGWVLPGEGITFSFFEKND